MATKEKPRIPNPYSTANCFSKLSFWWLLEIFRLGKNNNLREENLYNVLPENDSEILGDQLEKLWENELVEAKKSSRKPSLWKAIRKMFFWTLVIQGITVLTSNISKAVQPLLLARLILYFNPVTDTPLEDAYLYGSGLIILTILQSMMFRHLLFSQFTTGQRVRIACSSLLYRKALKLSCSSTGINVNGLIINIMSNDLAKFERFFIFCHMLWVTPLLMVIITYLLWKQLGLAGFAGILCMIVQIVPTQVIWYKISSKLRIKSAARIDKRVLLIGEIINGIRVIKMYAWENYFEKLVHLARKHEIYSLLQLVRVRSTNMAMSVFADRLALFCTIGVYVWLGNVATADRIFSTVHYFVQMRQIAAKLFPEAMFYSSATSICLKRMEDFLARKEMEQQGNTMKSTDNSAVLIREIDAMWGTTSLVNHLCNVNLRIVSKKLYTVVGPVGSGKSSLLKLILGELRPKAGYVSVHGTMSYASQEPWLFTGSIRDNILFGEIYHEERYKEVVNVCQLSKDFEQLPFGDKTLVGERGMSLSGGQCARVNLARAVYRDADVYLFDDPLSAVDAHVSRHLFEECIKGFLKLKTRILVTHQVQYLQETDVILVLNDGKIEFEGNYQSFTVNEKYLEHISIGNQAEKQETETRNRKNSQSSISFETEKEKYKETEPKESKEAIVKNTSIKQLLLKYCKAGGSYFTFGLMMLLFLITQLSISGFEYWLSYWTNQEDKRQERNHNGKTTNSTNLTVAPSQLENILPDEYINAETALYVSGGLVMAIVLLTNLKNFWYFRRALSSSETIHNNMFSRLLRTPMQFFNVNPSGRMINRFSKDTGTVDENMPNAILETLERSLTITAVFIQIIIINWWTVGAMLTIGFICLKLHRIYMMTARGLQRLEGNAKSPVFSLINSTLLGLPTIRSCRAQSIVTRNFDERQDVHTSASYLCYLITIAYRMWLELLATAFLCFMVYSFIPLKSAGTMGGDVGLALTQFLNILGILPFAMRQFADVVAQMTALERMFQYTELEQEGPFQTELDKKMDKNWPNRGEIKFENLSLRYLEKGQPVLKNLDFTIKPNMKIGVVGRTGAGKSSLIAALFRLTDFDGSLLIDNVDNKKIGLLNLRSKISIIPQEPTLFTTSLRDNLDPLGQYDDASLWAALRDVEMHRAFDSLAQPIDGNLSAGQRQLLCLARAIVRGNKILVLDEATANVDLVTDELIQTTIRSKFRHCTVITIAHRVNTIMDCDAVLVMDAGQVVEFDQPHNLLQKTNGYFSKIVEESGNSMNLRKMVEKACSESSNNQQIAQANGTTEIT